MEKTLARREERDQGRAVNSTITTHFTSSVGQNLLEHDVIDVRQRHADGLQHDTKRGEREADDVRARVPVAQRVLHRKRHVNLRTLRRRYSSH